MNKLIGVTWKHMTQIPGRKYFLTATCIIILFTTWMQYKYPGSGISVSYRFCLWNESNVLNDSVQEKHDGRSDNILYRDHNRYIPAYTDRTFLNITERNFCSGFNTTNLILCQPFYGRLGNNMFIYASNFCLAKKYGFRPIVPDFLEIYRIFNLSQEAMDFWKLGHLCRDSEKHIGFFNGKIIYKNFNISCTKTFRVNGMLQSFYNFIGCADDIRKEFVFRKDLQNVSSKAISDSIGKYFSFTLSKNFSLVVIHVRRGDYVKGGFPVAQKLFYDKARNYFRERFRHVIFIAITTHENDTREWCQQNLVNNSVDTFLAPKNSIEVDMYIMANADHVIVSSGTFGWWGAWLNRHAIVIKWNVLFNGTFWNPRDFYPPHWITLEGPGLGNYIDSERWLSQ